MLFFWFLIKLFYQIYGSVYISFAANPIYTTCIQRCRGWLITFYIPSHPYVRQLHLYCLCYICLCVFHLHICGLVSTHKFRYISLLYMHKSSFPPRLLHFNTDEHVVYVWEQCVRGFVVVVVALIMIWLMVTTASSVSALLIQRIFCIVCVRRRCTLLVVAVQWLVVVDHLMLRRNLILWYLRVRLFACGFHCAAAHLNIWLIHLYNHRRRHHHQKNN